MPTIFNVKCHICSTPLSVTKKRFNKNQSKKFYCCRKCQDAGRTTKKDVVCFMCKKEFKKSLSQIKQTHNNFCSKSCAAMYNNTVRKRKRKKYFCKKCQTEIPQGRTVCDEHNSNIIDWSNVTFGKMKETRAYQKHSRIRNLARKWYLESGRPKKCLLCKYDKHIDVCHIKQISDHSETSLITEINAQNNLVALCKNHHWEFDHHMLSKEEKDKIKNSVLSC